VTDSQENVGQDSALEAAPDGGGSNAQGKAGKPKQRTAAQQAQFEAMRAKRWAKHKADAARRAGVDMTGEAGPDSFDLSPTAPKVTTTAYTKPPKSVEQIKREQEASAKRGEDAPQRDERSEPASAGVINAESRGGLLAIIRDGLGL
jgi:hypothetical protein